jgi:hypothetical protein
LVNVHLPEIPLCGCQLQHLVVVLQGMSDFEKRFKLGVSGTESFSQRAAYVENPGGIEPNQFP